MGSERFFSLRSVQAWRMGTPMHLAVSDEGLTIRRKDVIRPARRSAADDARLVKPVVSAAVDEDGRWMLIDSSAAVWKADFLSGHFEPLLAAGHSWFGPGATIAALSDTWAAADPDAETTLTLLSESNGQVLWTRADWHGRPFRAHAIAADDADRIVVLAAFCKEGPGAAPAEAEAVADGAAETGVDGTGGGVAGAGADPASGIGTAGEVPPDDCEWGLLRFGPSGEADAMLPVQLLPPDAAAEQGGADGAEGVPRGIPRFELTLSPDGSGWLLDRERQAVAPVRFADAGSSERMEGTSDEADADEKEGAPGGEADAAAPADPEGPHGLQPESPVRFEPLPGEARGATAICGAKVPDAYWVAVGRGSAPAGRKLLLIRPGGRILDTGEAGAGGADRLLRGPNGQLFAWDNERAEATTLTTRSETAVWQAFGRRMGAWLSRSLDSTQAETVWHKLVVDAHGAPDTQIRIRYYASDRKAALAGGVLVPDLDEYISDPDIDPAVKLEALAGLWSKPIVDPRDALLFEAKGRYLWLHVELLGSELNAPTVRGVRVHFPRETYVSDLPALYQQDPRSKDFLERFLSMFQTIMEETDEKLDGVPRMIDPDTASGESLRWLLGWLGLDEDVPLTEAQLRELLREAPMIYKLRGTRYALETLVRIYTGEKPIVLEYDQLQPIKQHQELGAVAELLYDTGRNGFNVLVKHEHADTEPKRATLQNIIDRVKPAFTVGRLIVLQPWVYMDLHSYLGMNTVLSEPTLLRLDGRSSMPHHTITIDIGEDNKIGRHTRLELDSQLE